MKIAVLLCLGLYITYVRGFLEHVTCGDNAKFQALYKRFTSKTECASFQQVGKIIWNEIRNDHQFNQSPHYCLRSLLSQLGEYYRSTTAVPDWCSCHGHHRLWPYTDIRNCHHFRDPVFLKLRDDVYNVGGRHSVCTSHHTMWHDMGMILHDGSKESCQLLFVHHMSDSYDAQGSDCICTYDGTTTPPTTPTTPTTTTVATTPLSLNNYTCSKVRLVTAIALQQTVMSTEASHCPQASDSPSDALVLDMCTAVTLSTWTRGLKVMDNCANIAQYTPIATFTDQTYNTATSIAAVFIKCEQDGFEIAYQKCGFNPALGHATSTGSDVFNANSYYTIN